MPCPRMPITGIDSTSDVRGTAWQGRPLLAVSPPAVHRSRSPGMPTPGTWPRHPNPDSAMPGRRAGWAADRQHAPGTPKGHLHLHVHLQAIRCTCTRVNRCIRLHFQPFCNLHRNRHQNQLLRIIGGCRVNLGGSCVSWLYRDTSGDTDVSAGYSPGHSCREPEYLEVVGPRVIMSLLSTKLLNEIWAFCGEQVAVTPVWP